MNNEERDAAIADLLKRVAALEAKHYSLVETPTPEGADVQHEDNQPGR
jgi:hypothetical protein